MMARCFLLGCFKRNLLQGRQMGKARYCWHTAPQVSQINAMKIFQKCISKNISHEVRTVALIGPHNNSVSK